MSTAIEILEDVARTERRDALESLVVQEFKDVLMMEAAEELLPDRSFFELGLTSLGVTDLKRRLEQLLEREVSTNVLFNSPTVNDLMNHLTASVIPELFEQGVTQNTSADSFDASQEEALAELFSDLY